MASKTRYSSLLLGALGTLNRNFIIPLPGGCHLQEKRPLDIHYDCLLKIGYMVNEKKNYIECMTLSQHSKDISVIMKGISVGATLNSIFASVLRKQKTTIENVAVEPEIKNVIDFLNKSGANVKFDEKNRKIKIFGVQKLKPVKNWKVLDDRISGMTYFINALIHNKSAILNMDSKLVVATIRKLQDIGYPITVKSNQIIYNKKDKLDLKSQHIVFTPYPGIPTDLQPIFCLLMTQVPGKSRLYDKVYNQRTQYIAELQKMGANINIENINGRHIIDVKYSPLLKGNNVECTDIRGGMAVILASLLAKGTSEISNEYQVKRGYNSLVNTLNNFGFSLSDSNDYKSFIKKFNTSQWSVKVNESWNKSLHSPLLTKTSKICVLGDCFARNFNRWFKEQGVETGNIPWGIHFHQKAILRELQRTIKQDDTPNICWTLTDNKNKTIFIDPFRHPVEAHSLDELKDKLAVIEKNKINYFKNTDLFVISLSIGEVWEEKINGVWQPLGRGPTEENFNPEIHRYRRLTSEETKQDIIKIISTIKEINNYSKIVFMVSPVPLKHSLHDEHIYVSNNRSKTTLLNAIYEVMDSKPDDVFYFPAYEIVQKDNEKSYWQEDDRHLTAKCVVTVCHHFVNSFFSDKENFDKNKIFQVREVDKEGHIVREISDNTYFLKEVRYKLAKKIDKAMGTNIRNVELPKLAKKTEMKINQIYENVKSKIK